MLAVHVRGVPKLQAMRAHGTAALKKLCSQGLTAALSEACWQKLHLLGCQAVPGLLGWLGAAQEQAVYGSKLRMYIRGARKHNSRALCAPAEASERQGSTLVNHMVDPALKQATRRPSCLSWWIGTTSAIWPRSNRKQQLAMFSHDWLR